MAKSKIHTLEEIYSEGAVQQQKERYERSAAEFEKHFGRTADKRRKLYNGMIKCQLFMYFKNKEK